MIYRKILIYIFTLLLIISFTDKIINSKKNDSLCGPQTLFFICKLFDIDTSFEEICELTGYSEHSGTSMLSLYQTALKKELPAIPVKIEMDQLCGFESPSIAFVKNNHFLIVHGCTWRNPKTLERQGTYFF